MGILLLLVLIGVPLIEIGLFIEVGGAIGLWPTLAIVVITAMLGSWQMRQQGMATMARARAQLDQGQMPAAELFDGFCLLIGGLLLLTPGFMTDAIGLILFIPAFRTLLRRTLATRMAASGEARMWVDGVEVDPRDPSRRRGPTIDGEYRDVSDRPDPSRQIDDKPSDKNRHE